MNAAIARARAQAALTDLRPQPDDIAADAITGLSGAPRSLPSKYFYDAEGSRLFEAITRQPEYYLTRVELALMEAKMPSVAEAIGSAVHVVEFGSGSGRKTELLLEGLDAPVAYTPIEISRTALMDSVTRLGQQFPDVEMLPVCADFTRPVPLPRAAQDARRTLVFFPGSTLGNFFERDAVRLLASMRDTMGDDGRALIGIDLDKDPAVLDAAYNDRAGVTAAFTLNLLARLNREIGSDFDLDGFQHRAAYSRERMRIETALVSTRTQSVRIGEREFDFTKGEAIEVEISQKYTDASFGALAAQADLDVIDGWNDGEDRFGLRLLRPR